MNTLARQTTELYKAKGIRPLLSARDLYKTYGSVDALNGLNLDLYSHEILAIVGDNGSGKSTLVKVLSGLESLDHGSIEKEGESISLQSIYEANKLGIVSIFQNPASCGELSVSENIFMGRERMRGLFIDKKAMLQESQKLLEELGSSLSAEQLVRGLSVGQRKTVRFAQALLQNPDILILDEPTASMSVLQSGEILNQLLHMRALGKGILFVCHTLSDVFAISDRICVMRYGQIVSVMNTHDTTYEEVIAKMAGL
jgi:simple sugar transport system ATP-binding protein